MPLPESMKDLDQREGYAISIANNYDDFTNYLQKNLKNKE
jgi:hypothetical protein